MDWIKRNLYFLIGSLVAVALMGLAGWYLYSKWDQNNALLGQLDAQYAELKRLSEQKPHPGNGKVDNIQIAKEQQKELKAWIQKACEHFQRIPPIPIPESGKVTERDFTYALSRTIDQLHHEAGTASVSLPPKNSTTGQNYSFSFEEQRPRLSFAAGSLEPLSQQLGEVKAICDVLFRAKINTLDGIRRERVCEDDQKGPQTDYLPDVSVTNELAVLTPYEITFLGFSSELAAVLSGFASSPYAIIVKTINVEQAPVVVQPEQPGLAPAPMPVVQPTYIPPPRQQSEAAAEAAFAARYGGHGGRPDRPPPPQPIAQPVYSVAPVTAAKAKGALPTVLDEKQLKITMALVVVKLTCPK
ncbi:MAG TPA: Amuc_1100 family pilus-like protein [Candidatus Acidoferrum sp.]|nr:Amuc_1100 family pilus-like protein [Candidatus Acidoferrum sp.]